MPSLDIPIKMIHVTRECGTDYYQLEATTREGREFLKELQDTLLKSGEGPLLVQPPLLREVGWQLVINRPSK